MKRNTLIGAGLSLSAIAMSVGAQAADVQQACISEAEISAMTIYLMPGVISATQATCRTQLSPDGFMATGATAMAQRYAAKSDAVWPQTKSAFLKFAGGSKDKNMKEFNDLPDSAVRPLLDVFIQQKIAEEIKPQSCHDIEHLTQVLNALDPETTGALTGVIAALAMGDKDKPKICDTVSS